MRMLLLGWFTTFACISVVAQTPERSLSLEHAPMCSRTMYAYEGLARDGIPTGEYSLGDFKSATRQLYTYLALRSGAAEENLAQKTNEIMMKDIEIVAMTYVFLKMDPAGRLESLERVHECFRLANEAESVTTHMLLQQLPQEPVL